MSSLGFAHTLYAKMLQSREIDRQRKLEQDRFDQEYQDKALQRNLDEQRLTERAKELEFTRHLRVAEQEARAASLRGRGSAPTGYHNPAIEEAAKVAFEGGLVDRDNLNAERAQKQYETDAKVMDSQLDFRASAAGHVAGLEKGGYAELTDYGRNQVLPAYLDPSAPLPSAQGPLSRRVTPEEIQSRRTPRAVSENERVRHFDKMEAYLLKEQKAKSDWLDNPRAAHLGRLAKELRRYAARGYNLTEAMDEMAQLDPQGNSFDLIQQAEAIVSNKDAPLLDRTSGRVQIVPGGGARAEAGEDDE